MHIGGLVQDCSNTSALAMESLQSCIDPSIYCCTKATIMHFNTYLITSSEAIQNMFYYDNRAAINQMPCAGSIGITEILDTIRNSVSQWLFMKTVKTAFVQQFILVIALCVWIRTWCQKICHCGIQYLFHRDATCAVIYHNYNSKITVIWNHSCISYPLFLTIAYIS